MTFLHRFIHPLQKAASAMGVCTAMTISLVAPTAISAEDPPTTVADDKPAAEIKALWYDSKLEQKAPETGSVTYSWYKKSDEPAVTPPPTDPNNPEGANTAVTPPGGNTENTGNTSGGNQTVTPPQTPTGGNTSEGTSGDTGNNSGGTSEGTGGTSGTPAQGGTETQDPETSTPPAKTESGNQPAAGKNQETTNTTGTKAPDKQGGDGSISDPAKQEPTSAPTTPAGEGNPPAEGGDKDPGNTNPGSGDPVKPTYVPTNDSSDELNKENKWTGDLTLPSAEDFNPADPFADETYILEGTPDGIPNFDSYATAYGMQPITIAGKPAYSYAAVNYPANIDEKDYDKIQYEVPVTIEFKDITGLLPEVQVTLSGNSAAEKLKELAFGGADASLKETFTKHFEGVPILEHSDESTKVTTLTAKIANTADLSKSGYSVSMTGDSSMLKGYHFIVENNDKTEIPVYVYWIPGKLSGEAPTSVTAQLKYKVGTKSSTATSEITGNSGTFKDVPIDATVTDVEVGLGSKWKTSWAYVGDSFLDGLVIINRDASISKNEIPVTVNKVWKDENNSFNARPGSVKIQLKPSVTGVQAPSITLTNDHAAANNASKWTGTIANVPLIYEVKENNKFVKNVFIQYTPSEETSEALTKGKYVASYSGDITSGFTVTNTRLESMQMDIPVTLEWKGDKESERPTSSVKVTLVDEDGKDVQSIQLTSSKSWKGTFKNVPRVVNNEIVSYTIKKPEIKGYTVKTSPEKVSGSEETIKGFTITAAKAAASDFMDITVTKEWKDNGYPESERPASLKFVLADASTQEALSEPMTLSKSTDWKATFKEMPKKDENNKEIKYTVMEYSDDEKDETSIQDKYLALVSGDAANGFVVTNSYRKRIIKVEAKWNDGGNSSIVKPDSINAEVLNGTTVAGAVILNKENNWKGEVKDLDTFAKDSTTNKEKEIEYKLKEEWTNTLEKLGWIVTITGNMDEGFVIENSTGIDSLPVKVEWKDNDDAGKKRPSEIAINILANNKVFKTETIKASGSWVLDLKNLPKYQDGKEISYKIEVESVSAAALKAKDYTPVVTGSVKDGFTITITLKNATDTNAKTSLSGTVTWKDDNNAAKLRPSSLKVYLLQDGKTYKNVTAYASDGWKFSFSELPKYNTTGAEYKYTVKEDTPANYTSEVSLQGTALTISNVLKDRDDLERTIDITKYWDDNNDSRSKRPTYVTVYLKKNGSRTSKSIRLTASGGWTGSFDKLDVYSGNKLIEYTIEEVVDTNYSEKTTGDMGNGFTITNKYTGSNSSSNNNTTNNSSNNNSSGPGSGSNGDSGTNNGTNNNNYPNYNQPTYGSNSNTAADTSLSTYILLMVGAAVLIGVVIWMRKNKDGSQDES